MDLDTVAEAGLGIDADQVRNAYVAHAAELRRFATARLRDPVAAEDVVQEAFLRFARQAQAGRCPERARAWLYRVVLNLIISRARHVDVERRRSTPALDDEGTFESPEVGILRSERGMTLRSAMNAAGPDGRRSLILAAQGYSGREIATAIGRTESATRTLMCRARGRVRREFILQESA